MLKAYLRQTERFIPHDSELLCCRCHFSEHYAALAVKGTRHVTHSIMAAVARYASASFLGKKKAQLYIKPSIEKKHQTGQENDSMRVHLHSVQPFSPPCSSRWKVRLLNVKSSFEKGKKSACAHKNRWHNCKTLGSHVAIILVFFWHGLTEDLEGVRDSSKHVSIYICIYVWHYGMETYCLFRKMHMDLKIFQPQSPSSYDTLLFYSLTWRPDIFRQMGSGNTETSQIVATSGGEQRQLYSTWI